MTITSWAIGQAIDTGDLGEQDSGGLLAVVGVVVVVGLIVIEANRRGWLPAGLAEHVPDLEVLHHVAGNAAGAANDAGHAQHAGHARVGEGRAAGSNEYLLHGLAVDDETADHQTHDQK